MSLPQGTLGKEIKQSQFKSLAQEALLGLFTTTDAVKRRIGEKLEIEGITHQQYNVLRILRGSGETGLPTLEIGDRMLERTPGVTRLVDRLVKKGLVRRARSKSDRRVVICKLTAKGTQLVGSLDKPVETANNEALDALDDAEKKTLISLLDKVRGKAKG